MTLAGSSVVFGKRLAEIGPVFLVNALILAPAVALLLALCWRLEGGVRAPRDAWGPLAVQALCGIVLFRVCLFYGLPLTSAASAGILTSATPALSAVLAWLVLRERPSRDGAIGVLLTGLGVLALTVPGRSGAVGANPALGNALVLGAVLGEALWNVISKRSAARSSPLGAATATAALALAVFLPLAASQAAAFDFSSLDAAGVLAILYYAVGATVLAYLCWFHGVRRVGAGTAAVYTGWLPVSAVALSALVLHEPLTLWHGLGLACVLCATAVFARGETTQQATQHVGAQHAN